LGCNGSGKSTLFLHCNGILRPRSGVVRFKGEVIHYDRRSLINLRQHVGIVFQNADDQLFSASVAQDISFGPLNLGLTEREARDRVQMAAELCDITDLLDRPTHALSGGQKTRVALAGVLAMDPDVLLADETTASLDPWMRRQVFQVLERLRARGKTIVLATHHIAVARRWADLVAVMDQGQVIALDEPQRIFADRTLMARTGLDQEWII
jgi:cobalt/nickel transport system ATP-binding protein